MLLRKNQKLPNVDDREKLLLEEAQAIEKAQRFSRFNEEGDYNKDCVPDDDPFSDDSASDYVAPSLLNAGDIKKYVMETGLIFPFYEGGAKTSRMKDASYEGRIGDIAYIFEAGEKEPTAIFKKGDPVLRLPPNSIVFVESDLYFRIPEFIALRFNLQIKHVHRGLLLGTGPLVDPGYWGKLCIPLHNLTDEEYCIPADEGLIWIEFTKTTTITDHVGRPPLGRKFDNIKDFLYKASSSYSVGIRSSIDGAIERSADRAEKAEEAAKSANRKVGGIGFAAGLAGAIGLTGILFSSVLVIKNYNSDVRNLEAELQKYTGLLNGNMPEVAQATVSSLSEDIESLSTNVANLTTELEAERANTQQLEEIIESLSQSDRSNSLRFESLLKHCASVADDEKPEFCPIISE